MLFTKKKKTAKKETKAVNKNEFCFEEHKFDVMIGSGVVYILMIIMAGAGVICWDSLFETSVYEWLGKHPIVVFGVTVAGYLLLTVCVYRRWVNRCKKDL